MLKGALELTMEVPVGDCGLKEITGEVECHFAGQANPTTMTASPSLLLGEEGSGFSQITAVERMSNGQVQLHLRAELGRRYEIQVSSDLVQWDRLPPVVNENGKLLISDSETITQPMRFYRARFLP